MRIAKSKLWPDETGSTTALFAFLAVLIMLVAGISIDSSRAEHDRISLQRAADAAALAAATSKNSSDSARIQTATALFNATVALSPKPIPTITIANGIVSVTAGTDIATTLTAVGGFKKMRVGVNAQAVANQAPIACVIALEPGLFGIQANSDSTLDAACGIQVNSAHNEALYVNSNSHVIGTSVSVHGDAMINGGSSVHRLPSEQSGRFRSLGEPAGGRRRLLRLHGLYGQ